jgi:hypothetical protein
MTKGAMGKLKDRMPIVDAFIDDLRLAFGKEAIDLAIRDGIRNGTFHARENGTEIGSPVISDPTCSITLDRMTRGPYEGSCRWPTTGKRK